MRINNDRYDLNPDFQRDYLWDVGKQSRLIESCVMRIPLPVFYVAEAKDGRIIVVDGLIAVQISGVGEAGLKSEKEPSL